MDTLDNWASKQIDHILEGTEQSGEEVSLPETLDEAHVVILSLSAELARKDAEMSAWRTTARHFKHEFDVSQRSY